MPRSATSLSFYIDSTILSIRISLSVASGDDTNTMATQHFGFAARTPSWISDASRLPISTIPASIIALACVNIVTLLVVVGLKYRHLLFRHSYPSKVSLSPAVSHLEPLPEKHNEPSSIPPTSQLPELDIASPFPDLARPEATQAQREQMAKDKQLYHELQNLEDHPGTLLFFPLLAAPS